MGRFDSENFKEMWRLNTIWLAAQHRETCIGEDCNISLLSLKMMAEEAGVIFKEEDWKFFV